MRSLLPSHSHETIAMYPLHGTSVEDR